MLVAALSYWPVECVAVCMALKSWLGVQVEL
jgi:hypothetical protein